MLSKILIIIFFGIIIKRIFNQSQIEGLELFLLKIGIPTTLFTFVFKNDLNNVFNQSYAISYLVAFAISCFITISIFFKKKISEISIRTLCGTYANAAIYTMPVMTFILGDPKAAVLGNILQIVFIQPAFITIFSILQKRKSSIFKNIITSPIVFMPCLGLVLNYFNINLNPAILEPIEVIASASAPLSLLVFGMTLGSFKISKANKDIILVSIMKNIIHPFTAFIVGKYLFYLQNYWLQGLLISTAAPTAFVAYLLSKNFSDEGEFVRDAVALTSMVSILTLIVIYAVGI
jgi:malonate transporter